MVPNVRGAYQNFEILREKKSKVFQILRLQFLIYSKLNKKLITEY